ncbi:MAG: FtsX-like permease family protein [Gammaproteobacteria bacterium]|nr:FtsX-like permease family protein [Gammaproteobacteria bacterium]
MNHFFSRQRYLIDYTLASLLRRKGKHATLLLIYTLVIALLASVMLFTEALRQESQLLLSDAPEIVLQRQIAGRHALVPVDYLEKIGTIRGTHQIEGRLWGYHYDATIKANYTVMASEEHALTNSEIIIGATLARSRGVAVGDMLSLSAADGGTFVFTIKALLPSTSELVSSDLVLMTPHALRLTLGIPEGFYTDVIIAVRNPREMQKVAAKLIERLPDSRPILRDEILRTYEAVFAWRQGVVLLLLVTTVLAFIIFAWDRASGLSAEERREIGILKAVGWEIGDILQMKFWEGTIISLSAFLTGYLIAYLHVFYGNASLFAPVLKGWATLYPDFRLYPVIDALQLTTLFCFTVIPYAVATLVPTWRSAITDPEEVMR